MYQYTHASASPINLALEQVMGDTSQLDAQLQQSVALLDSATHKLTILGISSSIAMFMKYS